MITGLTDLPPLATACFLALVAVMFIVPMATPRVGASANLARTRGHVEYWYKK
jgi:hypothetical protein